VIQDQYPNVLLALCLWREARGQSLEVKRAIRWVILNRVAHPSGPFVACRDLVSTILCPRQFSSFNAGDPNAAKMPSPKNPADWAAWLACCAVVDEPTEDASGASLDTTGGANYYFDTSIQPPAWADPLKLTKQIDTTRFYKL